ncbi:MAG: Splicing factor [Bogoriella megaspora]|nr:MAG: Splicing factor [Bogoriella megaspora]
MDISSLLSPSDSPRETPPPMHAPHQATPKRQPPAPSKRSSSGLSQQITSSPRGLMDFAHRRPPLSTQSSRDILMADAPAEPTPPRAYVTSSLSKDDLQNITKLASEVAENTYAYQSHVQLIKLLHTGFINYVNPPDAPENRGIPHEYNLLQDLRQARNAMDTRFPVGEELWMDWLEDEMILAKTAQDCLAMLELFQKAVSDEPASVKIWRLYGDYLEQLYNAANGQESEYSKSWSEDDGLLATEVFKLDLVIQVWAQGNIDTAWHMNNSHLIWNKYIDAVTLELVQSPSSDGIQQAETLYHERLQQPHAAWNETFQKYSSFVTKYFPENYEQKMTDMAQKAQPAKKLYSQREELEGKLEFTSQNGDKGAEWAVYQEYLQFEMSPPRQSKGVRGAKFDMRLAVAVYDRAVTRFPEYANIWEEYVVFLMDRKSNSDLTLKVLARATRHCPWSGDLWSKRLLVLEVANRPFEELEEIKHKATKTALLELGSMQEILKVYTQWCGYLRRRAFAFEKGATEDQIDEAEVGIRSTIEDVAKLGEKKHGKEFLGEPSYKIERIYCKFLTQAGQIDAARDVWRSLIPRFGDSHDFWFSFHRWEMLVWGRHSFMKGEIRGTAELRKPGQVTSILREAIQRPNLDWPEKVIALFLNHCEQNEDAQELERAIVEAHKATQKVQARRAQEAEAVAAAAATEQQQFQHDQVSVDNAEVDTFQVNGKRKWEEENDEEIDSAKRIKAESGSHPEKPPDPPEPQGHSGPSSGQPAQVKRDRENATATVTGLPRSATELDIRKFFKDCGDIVNINLVPSPNSDTTLTATVEFESKEDVLAAKTKDRKLFGEDEIHVQGGSGSTLWVTNFPPHKAEENYFRELFKPYGDIVEIRWPSLARNAHRRFCYIQFLTGEQAQAATKLDGINIEGFDLVAKISDPTKKQDRQGAVHEGRELYVRNLHYDASERDVRTLFEKFGTVNSIRIPRNMQGKSKGQCYVVFEQKHAANAALALDNSKFFYRSLGVIRSVPSTEKRTTHISNNAGSPTPASTTSQNSGVLNPSNGQDAGSPTSSAADGSTEAHSMNKRERSVTILGIPDTVNDTRTHALAKLFGPVRKLDLHPMYGGALIEYESEKDAMDARYGLGGKEIAPGHPVRVGKYKELFQGSQIHKHDRLVVGKAAPKNTGNGKGNGSDRQKGEERNVYSADSFVPRSVQRGGRKRGGLGFKRGGGASQAKSEGDKGTGETKAKTQDDFRALLGKKA